MVKRLLGYIFVPLLVVALFISVGSGARAATFCVGCTAPGAGCIFAPSIGAAVGAAQVNAVPFDTIRVAGPGTYFESDGTLSGVPTMPIIVLPDTLRIQGGWDIATCTVRSDTMPLVNRLTVVNAGLGGSIFDVVAILGTALDVEVSGFTLILGTGLAGVIGGAINGVAAVGSTLNMTISDNILGLATAGAFNTALLGGAVNLLAVVGSALTATMERNVCTGNGSFLGITAIVGGCVSSIAVEAIPGVVTTAFQFQRNNIMAQNAALLVGGGSFNAAIALAGLAFHTTQTRNDTVSDNTVALAGAGDAYVNIPIGGAAQTTACGTNDMIISNVTGLPATGENLLIFGGGVPTVVQNRSSNIGQNVPGGILAIAGGINAIIAPKVACDGAGANTAGLEDSSIAQFIDPFGVPPTADPIVGVNYRLKAASECNVLGDKNTIVCEAAFPPTDFEGVPRDNSIGAAAPPPAPTPTPTPSPSPSPIVSPTPSPIVSPTPTPGGGGGGGCSLASGTAQLGTAMASILIPLIPAAFAIGYGVLRRRNRKNER